MDYVDIALIKDTLLLKGGALRKDYLVFEMRNARPFNGGKSVKSFLFFPVLADIPITSEG